MPRCSIRIVVRVGRTRIGGVGDEGKRIGQIEQQRLASRTAPPALTAAVALLETTRVQVRARAIGRCEPWGTRTAPGRSPRRKMSPTPMRPRRKQRSRTLSRRTCRRPMTGERRVPATIRIIDGSAAHRDTCPGRWRQPRPGAGVRPRPKGWNYRITSPCRASASRLPGGLLVVSFSQMGHVIRERLASPARRTTAGVLVDTPRMVQPAIPKGAAAPGSADTAPHG